ncbi:MAG: DNA-protecting protein DprA [Zetaproteobacteria bacterium]|nr:MAG: DNA-protecting protein DprA [Zetaproteobacteria bacterium]
MSHAKEQLLGWVRLVLTPGIGPVIGRKLVRAAGDIERLWRLSDTRLRSVAGIGPVLLAAMRRSSAEEARHRLDAWERSGLIVLSPDDERYPVRLAALDDAPLILFATGYPSVLNGPKMLAMVGSRKASRESRLLTYRWARYFCRQDVTIVSGMAAGVDWAAHSGALQEGTTVAVLGFGLQSEVSEEQQRMIKRIREHGCVISECLPEQAARPEHFPRRNRIIAGISDGVVVMAADRRSGALITAQQAANYGREVMAVPGNVLGRSHEGCHRLIREGALLVENPGQCMQNMGWQTAGRPVKQAYLPGNEQERQVLLALSQGPLAMDALSETCGLTIPELSSILLALELQGVVERLPGSRYLLNVELKDS